MMFKFLVIVLFTFNVYADNNSAKVDVNNTFYNNSYSNSNASAYSGATSSNSTTYNETKQHKNTPSMGAPDIMPTSNCMGTSSGALGISGFGISGGSSWDSDECNTRETSRMFFVYNMKEDAVAVLCSSVYSARAPSCKSYRQKYCHKDEIVAKRLNVDVCEE